MNTLKLLWARVPQSWKIELKSAAHTFVSAFALAAFVTIDALHGQIPLTKDALFAIGLAVLRAGIKAGWTAVWGMFVAWRKRQTP